MIEVNESDVLVAMQMLKIEGSVIVNNCNASITVELQNELNKEYWDEVRRIAKCRLESVSELDASGTTQSTQDIQKAVEKLAIMARDKFGNHQIKAHVWPYREQGSEMVSLDLYVDGIEEREWMPVIITAADCNDFSVVDEPDVVDVSEALHLVSLLSKKLDLEVSFR